MKKHWYDSHFTDLLYSFLHFGNDFSKLWIHEHLVYGGKRSCRIVVEISRIKVRDCTNEALPRALLSLPRRSTSELEEFRKPVDNPKLKSKIVFHLRGAGNNW